MKPLRIVLVMMEPPLPFGNAAARWYYVLLRGLVSRGHHVTAFATCSKPEEIAKVKAVFPPDRYELRCYPHPVRSGLRAKLETLHRPYSYMFSRELRADLERTLAGGYDILHLEQLWCGWLGLAHTDRALINVHHLVSIDLGETVSGGWRGRVERQLMFRAECYLLKGFRFFRACSPRLVEPIRSLQSRATIRTIPVGIDTTSYEYIVRNHAKREPIVTLIASMTWYPGYSAAVRLLTKLYPQIKSRVPEAKFQIVGWSARSALAGYLCMPDVEIYENVPSAEPYFKSSSLFLYAPARGSGMKIKILEAMARGVPVATTSEGVEGLPAKDGVHASISDDDEGLIEKTIVLLRDQAQQERQRRAARELVETHCSPIRTVDAIESIYARMEAAS